MPFVSEARAQTMMRDFNRLREAIRSHDTFEIEAAWEKCERWISQLEVKSKHDRPKQRAAQASQSTGRKAYGNH